VKARFERKGRNKSRPYSPELAMHREKWIPRSAKLVESRFKAFEQAIFLYVQKSAGKLVPFLYSQSLLVGKLEKHSKISGEISKSLVNIGKSDD